VLIQENDTQLSLVYQYKLHQTSVSLLRIIITKIVNRDENKEGGGGEKKGGQKEEREKENNNRISMTKHSFNIEKI